MLENILYSCAAVMQLELGHKPGQQEIYNFTLYIYIHTHTRNTIRDVCKCELYVNSLNK
jgi:hypothetical protein